MQTNPQNQLDFSGGFIFDLSRRLTVYTQNKIFSLTVKSDKTFALPDVVSSYDTSEIFDQIKRKEILESDNDQLQKSLIRLIRIIEKEDYHIITIICSTGLHSSIVVAEALREYYPKLTTIHYALYGPKDEKMIPVELS